MNKPEILNKNLIKIKYVIYDKVNLQISNIENNIEGKEYDACIFELNEMKVICRSSKVTPKKVGQFVTFWKRNKKRITEPFSETDLIDFYVINVKTESNFGQFVFPKSELINKGIISTKEKDGKRGFRVYPKWDNTLSKQANKTQEWQLKYFYEITNFTDLSLVKKLYNTNNKQT